MAKADPKRIRILRGKIAAKERELGVLRRELRVEEEKLKQEWVKLRNEALARAEKEGPKFDWFF